MALHLGTLVAVVAFFFRDWVNLIFPGLRAPKSNEGKLFWYIVAASIPGAIIGKLFEKQAESSFRNLALIGIMLIIMGLILYAADAFTKSEVNIDNICFSKSFLIALSQAFAIIQGVSRSGITMSTRLFNGLTRESAAKFSFLLSTPFIFGAGILEAKDLIHTSIGNAPAFIVGILTSAVVGFISIKFLLNYLENKGFKIFVLYRIIIGAMFIMIYFLKS